MEQQNVTIDQVLERPLKIIGKLYVAIDELTEKNNVLTQRLKQKKEKEKC